MDFGWVPCQFCGPDKITMYIIQCDQMTGLFDTYFAVVNSEIFPKSVKFSKKVQKFPNLTKQTFKIAKIL